ncbi:hypothetical protein IC802_15380 [Geobacillus sp. 44C]|nr:hypothetical protein IC802_15380 [Geobacillus sp. 44C]
MPMNVFIGTIFTKRKEHRLDRLKALLPKLQAQVQNKSSLYFALVGKGTGWLYFMQAVMLGIIWAAVFSTQGTLFSELFPTKVRYTGLSVGYQFAAAIVGFGPTIWTSMAKKFGPSPWIFGGFMMAGLALSLVLSVFVPDTTKTATSHYDESVNIVKS